MGTWSNAFDGNDAAADWFTAALEGDGIDDALDLALVPHDAYDECRAAAYLLNVLGRSAYVWPGDLNRLDHHVDLAISRLEAMTTPGSAAHEELLELWDSDKAVFGEISRELVALRAAHGRPGRKRTS